ncbi:MAG: hypothetical protein ACI4Q4_09720 [Oscillospiraceae bacterium]
MENENRTVAGYKIIKSLTVANAEYALGQDEKNPDFYATWRVFDHDDFQWGAYFTDGNGAENLLAAEKSLCQRALTEVNNNYPEEEIEFTTSAIVRTLFGERHRFGLTQGEMYMIHHAVEQYNIIASISEKIADRNIDPFSENNAKVIAEIADKFISDFNRGLGHDVALEEHIKEHIAEFEKDLAPKLYDTSYLDTSPCSDYTGKVMLLRPDALSEEYRESKYQLFLAEAGFGCNPNGSGRTIFGHYLFDKEKTSMLRPDFFGVFDEKYLPEWAKENLAELRGDNNSEDNDSEDNDSPDMN